VLDKGPRQGILSPVKHTNDSNGAETMSTDTTYTDPKDADFLATGTTLVWRVFGQTHFSKLYRPSAEALGWDKPNLAGGEAFAIGSRFGGFCYVTLKTTGRKLTKATGSDLYGTRAQVTMNIGPNSDEADRIKVAAWTVEGSN